MGNCFKRNKTYLNIHTNTNTNANANAKHIHIHIPSSQQANEKNDKIISTISIKRTNQYTVQYPDHEPRKESTTYKHTHKELLYKKDLPCFLCGKRHLEKVDNENVHLETHHFFCTKAAQNAIDWIQFGKDAKYFYNMQTGENIGAAFNWEEVNENPNIFVDSPQNMIVLCKKHHISAKYGIHSIPFPNWILQKYPKDNFQFLL